MTTAATAVSEEETPAPAVAEEADSGEPQEADKAPASAEQQECSPEAAAQGAADEDAPGIGGEAAAAEEPAAAAVQQGASDAGGDPGEAAYQAAIDAKAAGNEALKGADLPRAVEHYERAIAKVDEAMGYAPQPKVLKQNALVRYHENRFGIVETSDQIFGDYILQDMGTKGNVTERLGYQDVDIRFKRKEILAIPQEMFDLRLACLQNLCLVSLKLARASKRTADFEEVVARANAALAMDGLNIKALIRKGGALLELKDLGKAFNILKLAYDKTYGKDVEVLQLLQVCLQAKGKGKGKGKTKGKDGELIDAGGFEDDGGGSPNTFGPPVPSDSD